MAGAFSGHLLEAFNDRPGSIVNNGAISFDARAHGNPAPQPFFGFVPLSEDSATARQIATLQAKLDKKLGPEYVSQRPGPGGGPKLTYAEGWKIINLANEVFGFNGWNSSIVNLTTDFVDYSEESKRVNVGVTAIVRVTLRDGVYHEDVGYGILENGKSKAAALDKCKKEAVTDALKRTLRNFGNLLGNCLYDKAYAQEVVKIKVPPVKFDKNDLYRRPEFAERVPDPQPAVSEGSSTNRDATHVKIEEKHQPETPITYIPRHLRQEMAQQARAESPTSGPPAVLQKAQHSLAPASTSRSGSGTITAPTNLAVSKLKGLVTPIQTPVHAPRPAPPRAPPPPAVATSPLASMRNTSERSVSFVEPLPMPARGDSTKVAGQDMADAGCCRGDGDDEDAFPLSTQEDAFFAAVDLDEGDFGRPIDFEEGMSIMDVSALEPEVNDAGRSPAVPLQHQVRDHAGRWSNAGPSAANTNARHEAQAHPVAKPPSTSSDGCIDANPFHKATGGGERQQQHPRNGPSSITPAVQDIKRSRPSTTSTSGFHFPPGMKPPSEQQPQQRTHSPKPVMPTSVRTTMSNTSQTGSNVLKRSADMMLAVSAAASSTRPPPIQGMGLAQRQQQQQNANPRRPLDHHEGNDPKRPKR